MSYKFIEVSTSGPVTTVTINRPRVLNALHPHAVREMDEAFNAFQDDDDQWVAILTGAGDKAFCAGNDLKFQAEHGPERVRELRRGLRGGFGGLTRRTDCYKPIIAGGERLRARRRVRAGALMRHHRRGRARDVRAARAAGGTDGLRGRRAPAAALHPLSRGDGGDPRRQAAFRRRGARLWTRQRGRRRRCADGGGPPVVRRDPQGRPPLGAGIEGIHPPRDGMPLERALDAAFPIARHMYESEDLVEGPRAFAEKRPPRWKGR